MINAKLALHEVPPQSQTSPLKGNILPLGWRFSSLLTQEGRGMRREFPTRPKQRGERRVRAAGGFPSPARGHGGHQPGVGRIHDLRFSRLIRLQELPKIAAAPRWNGRWEEV